MMPDNPGARNQHLEVSLQDELNRLVVEPQTTTVRHSGHPELRE